MRLPPRRELILPVAIIFAGLIIAYAVYSVRIHQHAAVFTGDPGVVRPVTPEDHLMGSPDAPVKIVEYADIDSSYSKQFQSTMEQIMTEYLAGGKVVWVYRHFPAVDARINAETHAEAAECVASLGNSAAFFRFIDAIAAQAPGTDQFNPDNYPGIIASLGIPNDQFQNCLSSHTFKDHVAADVQNALASGATGSPYTVILIKGAQPIPINGALPYAAMKKIVDQAISSTK